MTGSGDRAEEPLLVVADAAVLDSVTVPIGVKDHVAGTQIIGDRIADTAQVHRPHVSDNTVGRLVRVPGKDEMGVGGYEIASKFLVVSVRRDPLTVVAARARVHAKHTSRAVA